MTIRPLALASLALSAAGVIAGAQSARQRSADIILTGGKVFTADSTHPRAEAIAIRGKRIVAVGTSADVRKLAGRTTRGSALAKTASTLAKPSP